MSLKNRSDIIHLVNVHSVALHPPFHHHILSKLELFCCKLDF